jgi:methylisocitrate lyase
MSPAASKTRTLRRAIAGRNCIPIPGAFNAATARLIERAGFPAVYVSGAGLANATAGVPDIGLLSLAEVSQLAGYIAAAVKIPVIADADTGFGGPANAAETVRQFERAGLSGLHIEDQQFPKRCGHLAGKELITIDEMSEKLRAAARARNDKNFLIIARTDARAVEGLASAIDRAREYLKAGADAIFPEALESPGEFKQFAKNLRAPLLANMTEFGKTPLLSIRQLQSLGYKMAIFPQTAFRVASKSIEQCLKDLKRSGTQKKWLKRMQTRKELYDLLDYDPASPTWP